MDIMGEVLNRTMDTIEELGSFGSSLGGLAPDRGQLQQMTTTRQGQVYHGYGLPGHFIHHHREIKYRSKCLATLCDLSMTSWTVVAIE